ncbi:CHAT domain-containing protein [Streptomyces sp. NPDC058595]|uniref:CHAT domain-containing protein n=1 Tax=Streptomyces sp. NPDC058595 TaxID=3346550 RepID=UPI003669B84C
MIDHTHPARRPGPDGGAFDAVLRTSTLRAAEFLESPHSMRALDDLKWSIGEVQAACDAFAGRQGQPTVPLADALERWLASATCCLDPYHRLLEEHRRTTGAWDRDPAGECVDYLGTLHNVHEEADRCLRTLVNRRDGIPPARATARMVAARSAHQGVVRRGLKLLPPGDARRDQWRYVDAFLTQRLAEYGAAGRAELVRARAEAAELRQPGSVLDDDVRRHLREIASSLTMYIDTGADPSRTTGLAAGVLDHRANWLASPDSPTAAARFGGELFRAVQLGVVVEGLGLRDAVEALEAALRDMDDEAPERPEVLAVRALAYAQSVAVDVSADRDVDVALRQLDAVRALLPPDHEHMLNLLLAQGQLLTSRADHTGSLSDIRSALTLLRRVRGERLADPLHRLYADAAFASTHLRFHFHAGSDDADCTGTGDDAGPAEHRAGHSASTHEQLRLYADEARTMAAQREGQAVEVLALILQTLGAALLLAATYPDGPGAGPHRGAARDDLVAEARQVMADSLAMTAEESPYWAGRELHHRVAALTHERTRSGDAAAVRGHIDALGRLAERPDVVARPALQEIIRAAHSYASDSVSGARTVLSRADNLRALEARRAAQPHAVHAAAVEVRMHLARAYRTDSGAPTAAGQLGALLTAGRQHLGRGTRSGGADRRRARELGVEVLGMLARRALVQDVAADAVLTAERAGTLSREIAGWCVQDGAYEEAVGVLERGRALALHTEMAGTDVRARLTRLGHADLAERWHGWRTAAGASRAGEGAAVPPAPGTPWDPYAEHPLPDQLGVAVRKVLEEHGALDDLIGPLPVPDIAAALRRAGADELVHLLPAGPGSAPGGALRVGSDGRVRWSALPGLAATAYLDTYLTALESLLSSPGSPGAAREWRARLHELCDWAGSAVIGPLEGQLGPWRGPGRVPRLVLVPLGPLAAVPWSAARTGGRTAGRHRLAVDGLVLSTAPSARMFAATAARPPVRAADSALLVLGLTGKEIGVSSSRGLDRLYGDTRLLTPDGRREGDTRPGTFFAEMERACGEHGIVDISAHLMPDPSDSWRSHLVFGGTRPGARPDERPGARSGAGVDRLSVQAIAARRFPVPPAGPGLCVSLASCINSLPRRHHDESFTMAAAFLAGGASSVLGSLWPVRLHATALLDLLFHHRLREGAAPAHALREAQLWMLDPARSVEAAFPRSVRPAATEFLRLLLAAGRDPADPALWAGLVAVGR